MGKRLATVIAAALVVTPAMLAGQQQWTQVKCDVKAGHYLVNSAVLYLQDAAKTHFDDKREKDLQDALRVLEQALTSGGQEKNPAAWYYLGRYYVVRNDALGADSAFTRAQELLPSCKDDIQFWRRNWLWIPAYKAGVEALNAQNFDSAITVFRIANKVYDAEPQGFTALAAAFFNAGHADSAAKYFRRAVEVGADSQYADMRKDALFNLGNAFYIAEQHDSAAAAYAEYLALVPTDMIALTRLGDVLATTGQRDSAMAVYRRVISSADSVDPVSLFNIGVSIYNAAPSEVDTAQMGSTCRTERRGGRTLTAAQRRQVNAGCDSVTATALKENMRQSAEHYRLAAQAFSSGLKRDPFSRDGLFNLGNCYLALRQTDSTVVDSMLAAAQRLIVVDPLNRNSIRLLAQAWQLKGKSDSALHYVILADSLLPVDLTIGNFTPGEQGVSVSGMITNYHETPVDSMRLEFEFLNGSGEVVDTQTLVVPALKGGDNHPFQLQASGAGILAWRYKQT
jgi:tetratricopeptide (TPR) repeat protein